MIFFMKKFVSVEYDEHRLLRKHRRKRLLITVNKKLVFHHDYYDVVFS